MRETAADITAVGTALLVVRSSLRAINDVHHCLLREQHGLEITAYSVPGRWDYIGWFERRHDGWSLVINIRISGIHFPICLPR